MFNHALKAEAQVKKPVSKMGVKALPENSQKNRVLSYQEQDIYLAKASAVPMLWDVVSIILETGMRPEEV